MKKFFLFLTCLSLLILASCGDGNGGDPEQISDIPDDWDYSNVVDGDETPDQEIPPDNPDTGESDIPDPTDTGDTQQDDSTPEETPDDNETPLPHGCGDGKVDYDERCDSTAPMTCSSLNSNMTGPTKCLTDCKAYDMAQCGKKVWGVLNISFKTNYIMNIAKLGDPNYVAQNALPYSAFNGLYGEPTQMFPIYGDGSVSFAVIRNYTNSIGMTQPQLIVKQNPASGYPRHELEFSPGAVKAGGDYSINAVDIFDLINGLLKIVRYRLIENQNGTECIMGIAQTGTVKINSASDNLQEGGSVEIVAKNVDFYYPTEIPGRNYEEDPLSDEVLGYPLCEK